MAKPKPKPSKPAKPRGEISKIITGDCAKTPETQIGPRLILGRRW